MTPTDVGVNSQGHIGYMSWSGHRDQKYKNKMSTNNFTLLWTKIIKLCIKDQDKQQMALINLRVKGQGHCNSIVHLLNNDYILVLSRVFKLGLKVRNEQKMIPLYVGVNGAGHSDLEYKYWQFLLGEFSKIRLVFLMIFSDESKFAMLERTSDLKEKESLDDPDNGTGCGCLMKRTYPS